MSPEHGEPEAHVPEVCPEEAELVGTATGAAAEGLDAMALGLGLLTTGSGLGTAGGVYAGAWA